MTNIRHREKAVWAVGKTLLSNSMLGITQLLSHLSDWRFFCFTLGWNQLCAEYESVLGTSVVHTHKKNMVTRFWFIYYWSAIRCKVYLGNYVITACHCGKEFTFQCKRNRKCVFDPWVGNILWRRNWQPTPVFLPRKNPGTEESGRPQSMGLQRVRYDWAQHTHTHTHTHRHIHIGKIVYEDQYQWNYFCVQWTGLSMQKT